LSVAHASLDRLSNLDLAGRRFIESVKFPFARISEASAVEKGPGRPPHWEMVFWWTRKPLISARAVIAGCLLPENTRSSEFLRSIGVGIEKAAHRVPPRLRFERVRLLDPFACFGSIPLEGLRLGLSVTACDLLPVGYVFLKAVLEYPAKYGKRLMDDVKRWGEWVTKRLKEDPIIKELYDEDVAVYIGSWEVKCPNCGRWTPLIGNSWLARVKGEKGSERLAWMEPKVVGERVEIEVVDLNKMLGSEPLKEAQVKGVNVKVAGKEFKVPESNIEARRETATCLLCHQPIMQIDPQTGKHYTETKNLQDDVKERLRGYVKYALELYNRGEDYGTNTELPPWMKEAPAKQKLLVKVKVKEGDLEFEPCTEKDQEKLEKAKEQVKKLLETNDPDIPREAMPIYEARSIWVVVYGFNQWYKLFNPRQLLTLVKLVKLVREAGKQIEQEKIKEGLSQKEAHKYAETITMYLTIGLAKQADYNSIVIAWNPATGFGSPLALLHAGHTLSFRGIAMSWNFVEYNFTIDRVGYNKFISMIVDSLSYLVSAVSGNFDNAEVLLDDATVLGKLDLDEKFALIVTDPPYYDDVPYAELSDFYYVWLKRVLSDIEDGRLVPRFLPEAFFEKVGDSWVEVSTQWEKYALSEVSLNPPRLGSNAKYEDGVKHFQNLLNSSFINMASRVVDDGLLVTYYAHTDPDAWKALLEAGWEAAGLKVTNAFPLTTESAQSVVKRGKLSMDTSIVVVWRKGSEGVVGASLLYGEMVESAASRAKELMDLGVTGRDLVIGTLAAALATATKYREIRVMGRLDTKTLVDKYVYPATYLGLAKAMARKAELKDGVKSPDAMFYLLVKSTLAGAKKKVLESTDLRLFSIGTSLDVNMAIKGWKILRAGEEEGAKVARAKSLVLVEPASSERSRLAELLDVRGVGLTNPNIRCVVDALHYTEYLAIACSRDEFRRRLDELKGTYPSYIEEALSLAKILAGVLPDEDVEKGLCEKIMEHLSPVEEKLTRYPGR